MTGRVLDLQGKPASGARLTIWQANTFGRYVHPDDLNPAPLDPNFVGFATIQSSNDGAYRIQNREARPVSRGARLDASPPHSS